MDVLPAFDIIYLGGPSSSGKTTLAKALQEKFPDHWLRVGIDQVIGMTPAKLHDWTGGGPKEGCFWRSAVDPTGQPIQELQVGPFGVKLAELFHDLVLFLASKGWRLVIDDVPLSQGEVDR